MSTQRLALFGGPLLALVAIFALMASGLERSPAVVAGIALWCALWWILEPVTVLVILFVGLYLVTTGLDELANPRLRRNT